MATLQLKPKKFTVSEVYIGAEFKGKRYVTLTGTSFGKIVKQPIELSELEKTFGITEKNISDLQGRQIGLQTTISIE